MAELMPWLQLVNLAILPAVWGLFRLVRAIDKIEAFMEHSTKDRLRIHARIDPIERAMLKNGTLQ